MVAGNQVAEQANTDRDERAQSWCASTRQDVVNKVRNAFGAEDGETHHDAHIDQLKPISRLRMIMQWELGDKEWAGVMLGWAIACGIEIGDC